MPFYIFENKKKGKYSCTLLQLSRIIKVLGGSYRSWPLLGACDGHRAGPTRSRSLFQDKTTLDYIVTVSRKLAWASVGTSDGGEPSVNPGSEVVGGEDANQKVAKLDEYPNLVEDFTIIL